MAVSEQTPYKEYTANGSTNSFNLGFDCENQNHLIVLVDDVEPAVGSWSLTGGAVVFGTAPENGKKITIQRNTPFSRNTDYQSYNNSFRPHSVNGDFDRVWLKLQELGFADWALRQYVDKKDNELKAFLLAEIQAQGVALDQLDEYYNYLMQRLAQIAVDQGWDASFVVDGNKNQKQINADVESSINNRYTKAETYNKTEVDDLAYSVAGGKYSFTTFAKFDAVKAIIPANAQVNIDEAPTGTTTWGQGLNTWDGVTLTKSVNDPFAQSKNYADANAIFKPVDLVGTENLDTLPNGLYYIPSTTVATSLDSQLPPTPSTKVGFIEISNRNNVLRRIIFTRYKTNANGEYEVWRKTSNGSGGSLVWESWQKDASRYEISNLTSAISAKPSVNLFTDIDLTGNDAYSYQAVASTENGFSIASINSPSGSAIQYDFLIDGKLFAVGQTISFTLDVNSDAVGTVGADISIQAFDVSNVQIGSTVTARNSIANTYEAITASLLIPANTFKFRLRVIRRNNATFVKCRKPVLTSTAWKASFVSPAAPMIGVGHLNTYISATGSDTTGDGSISNPYKTTAKAQSVMSGVGDLIIKAGVYDGLQVNVAKAKDMAIIGLGDSSLGRPKIRYSTKLTGITNVSGKVYKASIVLTGQPNYIWHDGVADVRTLAPASEIHFGLRGRSHRLPCTKIEKTNATSRATAILEIEGSSDPRCFYDIATQEMLFSIGSGGDATSAEIYVPVTGGYQTLFTGRTSLYLPPSAKIQLIGLDVWYGSINNIGACARIELDDCSVLGAAANNYDLAGSISLVNCEAAGHGSGITSNGDGFNFHNNAHVEHRYLYMHDGYDDGISSHENCFEIGFGAVSEYNGGGGFTPAYGAQGRIDNSISRKNNGVASRFNTGKSAGFECHAANTGGGDDISTLTSFEVVNCISIGDKNGFMDMYYKTGSNSRMKAYNCTSIDPVEYGFACSEIQDCSHSGTGTAKAPDISGRSVTVRNTVTVA